MWKRIANITEDLFSEKNRPKILKLVSALPAGIAGCLTKKGFLKKEMNLELLGHIKTLVQDAKKAAETIGKKMEKNYAKRDSFLKINKWLSDLLKRIAEAAGANLSIDYGLILGIAQSSAIPLQVAFKLLTKKGAGPSSSELKKRDSFKV